MYYTVYTYGTNMPLEDPLIQFLNTTGMFKSCELVMSHKYAAISHKPYK